MNNENNNYDNHNNNSQQMNNGLYQQAGQQGMNNNQQIDNFNNQQNFNVNSQIINNCVYKLTLTRPKTFVASLIKFKIFIDNNEVGTIKNGETVVLNVSFGNHTISFNKTIEQSINISSDTYADVLVIAGNRFGLSNIRDNNGLSVQNSEIIGDNVDKIIKSAKWPLIFSCGFIALTFLLLFTVKKVISPVMYGISIGYTIINLSSLKKHKLILKEKYNSLYILDIISLVVSIVGMIISLYLMIG